MTVFALVNRLRKQVTKYGSGCFFFINFEIIIVLAFKSEDIW